MAVVDTNHATRDVPPLKLLKSILGILNGRELDVTKAFRVAIFWVGRQTNTDDIAVFAKSLAHHILSGPKGDVSDEQGAAWLAEGVTELLGTVLACGVAVLPARIREVKVDFAAINRCVFHSSVSFGRVLFINIFDVSKSGK